MKGLRHKMHGGSSPNAKDPISTQTMQIMAENARTKDDIMINVGGTKMTISSLCFYGFLRISECLSLDLNDVKITDDVLTVFIKQSKTDQDGHGVPVYIQKNDTMYSPHKWLPKYLEQSVSNIKLFQISIRGFRSKLIEYLKKIGVETTKLSTHSFKKGGAHIR